MQYSSKDGLWGRYQVDVSVYQVILSLIFQFVGWEARVGWSVFCMGQLQDDVQFTHGTILSLCKVDNWLPLQHGVEAQIVTLFYKF